ncbi:hypothetical protein, conserved [Eimeria tenella]|uniref:Uncharacterized protein n=1 Tax=Eimeria tenella TaxID=5802 RepID=U6KNB2_EIMTE|nr:hypothetical protein, conserved [Eimeria tenella]CDJ36928.1 hypothetical protein, conserved [Eimeria tenella]|eukprot:XP_013227766.1 hypothetical protein, conserved [Eimeria tenella]
MLLGDLGEVIIQKLSVQNILKDRLRFPLQELTRSLLDGPAENLQIQMEKEVEENLEMLLGYLGEVTVQKLSLQNILKERLDNQLQKLPRTLLKWPAENIQIDMKKRVEENLEMLLGCLGEVTVQELIPQNILKKRLEIPLQELTRGLLDGPAENLQIHMAKEVEENLGMLLGYLGEVTVQERILQNILKERLDKQLQKLPRALLNWPPGNIQIDMERSVEENLEMLLGYLGEVTVQELIPQNILMERLERPRQELTRALLKWPAENLQLHMEKELEENQEMVLGDLGEVTIQKLSVQNILKDRLEIPLQGLPRVLLDGPTENIQVHMENEEEENLEMLIGDLGEELIPQNILKKRLEIPLQELTRGLLDGPAENLQIHMAKEVEENLGMLLGYLGEVTVQERILQNILKERLDKQLQKLPRALLNWPPGNIQIDMERSVEENLEMLLGYLGEVTVQELIPQNILMERLERPRQELTRALLKWPAENLQLHMEKELEENQEMVLGDLGEVTIQKLSVQNILKDRLEIPLQGLPRVLLDGPTENIQVHMENEEEENLEMLIGDLGEVTVQDPIL